VFKCIIIKLSTVFNIRRFRLDLIAEKFTKCNIGTLLTNKLITV